MSFRLEHKLEGERGDGMALWLLGETFEFADGYTNEKAPLFGGNNSFRGIGIFIIPDGDQDIIMGRENTDETIDKNSSDFLTRQEKCRRKLVGSGLQQLKLIYSEGILLAYTKSEKETKYSLCFSLTSKFVRLFRKFAVALSASTSKTATQLHEVTELKIFSDVPVEKNISGFLNEDELHEVHAKDILKSKKNIEEHEGEIATTAKLKESIAEHLKELLGFQDKIKELIIESNNTISVVNEFKL